MALTLSSLADHLLETLKDPRNGLRRVLNTAPSSQERGLALILMAVSSALLLHLGFQLAPLPPGNPMIDAMMASPFTTALAQAVTLGITAGLVYVLGRARGGQGTFADSVLAVTWLQAIFVAIQALQTVFLVVLPPVASLVSLLSIGVFFWLLSSFVAEVHGFASVLKTLAGVVAALLAMSFVITFLLAMLLGPGAFPNV